MIYLIGTWLFLLVTCLTTGIGCLSWLKQKPLNSSVDQLFLSIWLGLGCFLGLLTFASLGVPLSLWIGISILTITSLLGLSSSKARERLKDVISYVRQEGFILSSLFLIVAFFCNQQIQWFDTGMYHLGLISWLNESGAVPGIALINLHFAKFSSWFALSAPWLFHVSQDRASAVTNGFMLLIACLQLVLTLNTPKVTQRPANLFIIFFLAFYTANLLFLQPLFTSWNLPITISFSPDVPVNLFVGIVPWSILLISEAIPPSATHSKSDDNRRPVLDASIIPLLLASAAVTIKVTAFPLLVVSALFYLSNDYRQVRRWLMAALIPSLFLIPFLVHGVIASGCPLAPTQFLCVDVPWAVGSENSAEELQRVTGGITADTTALWSKWFGQVRRSSKLQVMAAFLSLSAVLSVYLTAFAAKTFKHSGLLFVVGTAWSGIVFLLAVSTRQILRFGFGYFLLIPCLFLSLWLCQATYIGSRKIALSGKHAAVAPLGTLSLLAGLVIIQSYPFGRQGDFSWVLPPRLPTPMNYRIYTDYKNIKVDRLITQEVNGIVYTYPSSGNSLMCWSDVLVCTRPKPDVYLRRPAKGLAGGFIRQSERVSD